MNALSTLFYRIPRLTAIAVLIILAAGLGALFSLGRQEDPTLVERYGYVLTLFPGADAERVEALVTEPLEAALQELTEIDELISFSRGNLSQVTISMRDDLSVSRVDEAWTLVRQQVALAEARMPPGIVPPRVERQYVGANTLLVSVGWDGEGAPPMTLMNRLALDLEDMFQNYPGTEETELYGPVSEEIRVVVDPDKLAAAGLSVRDAAGLIGRSDAKAPAGQMRGDSANLGLEVSGAFDSIDRVRDVPLLQRGNGSSVRVGDVARVEKSETTPPERYATINNERVVMVGAFIEPNNRVDLWAAGLREKVADFAEAAPRGVAIEVIFDQSGYTEARLNGLATNLFYSALIVFVVLFFAMGWRAALIVGTALPLTVCLVLILFAVFQMPLHQMSVTGLVIALGLLIDNAIVVTDEIDQKRAAGYGRLEAIEASLGHLFGPLFASTLTTALAFAPIALLPGGAGEFIGMLAVSVIFAVISSFVIAITVVAAFSGWFLRPRIAGEPKRWWRDGVSFDILSEGYRWSLNAVLRAPWIGVLLGVVPPLIAFMVLLPSMPQQFFPPTERDQFQIELQLPPEANVYDTIRATEAATDLLLAYPGVEDVHWVIGSAAPRVYYNAFNNSNGVVGLAAGFVKVTSAAQTRIIVPAVQNEVREMFPQARFLAVPYEQGPPTSAPIEFYIQGPDISELDRLGNEARRILGAVPGITYTWGTMQTGSPTIRFKADETATDLAGVRLRDLAADISAELDGVPAAVFWRAFRKSPSA